MSGDLEVEAQSCACHRPSFQHAVLATTLERPAALAALFQDSREGDGTTSQSITLLGGAGQPHCVALLMFTAPCASLLIA